MVKVKERGSRRWYCEHEGCKMKDHDLVPLVVNKDVSACFNMLTIFVYYLARGVRHEAFMPAGWRRTAV
jgi:hypothetical protein